jgi:hypothetical protein
VNADTLRQALRSHADDAPTSVGLLDAVRTRSRRRRRRRLLGSGAVAVAVAALAMLAATLLTRPAAAPVPPASAVPGPTTSTPPAMTALVPARPFDLPAFPFTPGWAPPGVSEAFYWYEVELDRIELHHYDARRGYVALSVTMLPKDPKPFLEQMAQGASKRRQTVTVQGHEALVVADAQVAGVGWRHRPGQWIMVRGSTVDEVVRYANALVDDPFPARTPFTFALTPPWATALAWTAADEMVLGSPHDSRGIEVKLRRGGPGMPVACIIGTGPGAYRSACPLPRTAVRAGAHEGELVGDAMILVYLEDGLALHVTVSDRAALSRDDLARFAGGITVTPHSRPKS